MNHHPVQNHPRVKFRVLALFLELIQGLSRTFLVIFKDLSTQIQGPFALNRN